MIIHDIAIIIVVIITVCFLPTLSPIYPNSNAPIGFRAKVEQNVKADKRELVKGSNLGKNISFSTTAIWTNNIRSVGSRSGAHTQTQEPRFLPPPRQTRRAVFPQRAFP